MNNYFFTDGAQDPLPREQVRIVDLGVSPYPDGGRVRLTLAITPFMERPNLEIFARKQDGPIVAEMSVIETMTPDLEFTLHIRGVTEIVGTYTLRAELYYDDRQAPQDSREISFSISPPENGRDVG